MAAAKILTPSQLGQLARWAERAHVTLAERARLVAETARALADALDVHVDVRVRASDARRAADARERCGSCPHPSACDLGGCVSPAPPDEDLYPRPEGEGR